MAGFAGSQRLDERRRRRWAVEQDALPNSKMDLELTDAEDSSSVAATLEFPIADFVPLAIWKHVAVGILLAVVSASIVQADSILPRWFALDPGGTHCLFVYRWRRGCVLYLSSRSRSHRSFPRSGGG